MHDKGGLPLQPMRDLVRVAMSGGVLGNSEAIPFALAQVNHMLPLAYKLGYAAGRDEYAASLVAAARRASVVGSIAAELQRRGVRAAPIKGFALAQSVYGDPAERPMNDVDLLVPVAELAEGVRALHALGFLRVGMARKLSGFYHAVVFERDGHMIELHRSIVQHHRTKLYIGEMWRRATADPKQPGLYRLDDVDQLLLCLLHVARHELAVPAINFVDIHRLYNQLSSAQRDVLLERARTSRVSRSVAAVLGMTELLARGERGRPDIGVGSNLFASTDDVLRGVKPERMRQLAQKLLLTEGPRELAGLSYVYLRTYLDGRWRTR